MAGRRAVAVSLRDHLEQDLNEGTHQLLAAADCHELAEEIDQRNQELLDTYPQGDPSEAREDLLEQVFRGVAALRRAIRTHLDSSALLAFRLGEVIEEGLCCAAVSKSRASA